MRQELPTHLIDMFPDQQSFRNLAGNHRQIAQYQQFLKRAIQIQLTDRQAQMISLYYFNNMTMAEIAEELRINKATVSRTLRIAKKRLSDLARVYFDIAAG